MVDKVTKSVTLKTGEVTKIRYNRVECPVCLNGGAYLVEDDKENNTLIFMCERCGSVIRVPYVDYHDEPLDE